MTLLHSFATAYVNGVGGDASLSHGALAGVLREEACGIVRHKREVNGEHSHSQALEKRLEVFLTSELYTFSTRKSIVPISSN